MESHETCKGVHIFTRAQFNGDFMKYVMHNMVMLGYVDKDFGCVI